MNKKKKMKMYVKNAINWSKIVWNVIDKQDSVHNVLEI